MLRVLLAAVFIPVAAMGQLSRTSETIDVNVVEVDVVVLDAQGNPVPGLRASDFDLRVGGHRRAITNFYPVNRRVDESLIEFAQKTGSTCGQRRRMQPPMMRSESLILL